MHIYNPQCLRVLRGLADEHGLVLIFDEIATGFGRTGELFAAEHAGVAPDIMCVGKALTGGYLTLAATLVHEPRSPTGIGASESGRADARADLHGQSAGVRGRRRPTSALLATASWRGDVRTDRGAAARPGWRRRASLTGVADVRVLGAVGVIQLDQPVDVGAATAAATRARRLDPTVPRPRLHHAAVRHRRR